MRNATTTTHKMAELKTVFSRVQDCGLTSGQYIIV